MYLINQRKRIARKDGTLLVIAAVFLCMTFISSLVRAEVMSVDDLEFSRIQLIGNNELEFTQDATSTLKIRGKERRLDQQPYVIEGDTLVLGVNTKGKVLKRIQFKVTAPSIEALMVEGSGDAYVRPLEADKLLVSVEGSGTVRMFDVEAEKLDMRVIGSGAIQAVDVSADEASLTLKGSGDIQLGSLRAGSIKNHMAGSGDISVENGGEADVVEVAVMGSGDVVLNDVQAGSASVTIMGSGDVKLRVEDQLEVSIMGSGDLVYYGSPEVESTVLGSGDIRQRD